MIAAVRSALTRTPMRLYAAGMVSANAIGAVIVFVLARFILPLPVGSEEILSDRNYLAFFVYLPVAIGIGIALGLRVAAPLVRWLHTGGTPTDETAIAVIRLPLRQLGVHVLLWALGVAVFVAVNASAALRCRSSWRLPSASAGWRPAHWATWWPNALFARSPQR